jgi:putative endonuclease
MAYVYMLRCADDTLYTGSTTDLDRRVLQHQIGEGSEYTKVRLPVVLVWHQWFERVDEAFAWEKRIQGWSRAKKHAFAVGGVEAIRGWSARRRA